jgi:hypothetical protein
MHMTYQEFVNQLSGDELARLQIYAKNRVMEPFAGQSAIETIQKADQTLNKGLVKVKKLGEKTRGKSFPGISSERLKKILKSSQILDNLGRVTLDVSHVTKAKLKDMEEWTREATFDFIKKGLELSKSIDYENWIVEKASRTLKKPIIDLNDIKELTDEERTQLVQTLYPHKSNRYKSLLSSFDKTFSIFLGLIVATNIPGTGILVSLINIAKTIIRISNGINSISIIHGYQVENFAHLFHVSAAIIQSLNDWDNNPDHSPLNPQILADLYEPSDRDFEKELVKLLEAAGSKELYIAIPGIGMLSLGKINLDNYKLDSLVMNLVGDYFLSKRIETEEDKSMFTRVINDFELIYSAIKDLDYLSYLKKKMKNNVDSPSRKSRINNLFRSMLGNEPALEERSNMMNNEVEKIFHELVDLPQKQKKKEKTIQNRILELIKE